MNRPMAAICAAGLLACLGPVAAAAVDEDLARYAAAKQSQVRDYAQTLGIKVPPLVWQYFNAVRVDDWETATNLSTRLENDSGRYADSTNDPAVTPALQTVVWSPILEMIGTYEQFHDWNNHWLHRFGREVIDSIPANSLYFGGTDAGRFVISAEGTGLGPEKQFYVLTQNQLADQTYMDYLRKLYGSKIYIPTPDDSQAAFEAYRADAAARQARGQLKPGEDVRIVNGHVQVSGRVAVMAINGLLVQVIVNKNPGREVFVEQSVPMEWMYPCLSPHGLIFELHAKPLAELNSAEVAANQACWEKLTRELAGGWLGEATRLKEVCDFVDKTYLDKNFAGFPGDPGFARNFEARKEYSRLRAALAELYAWREQQAAGLDERRRMKDAADLAFRQAYAFCPESPEVIYPYAEFLLHLHRPDDAFLIAKTSLRLDPENPEFHQLIEAVRKAR